MGREMATRDEDEKPDQTQRWMGGRLASLHHLGPEGWNQFFMLISERRFNSGALDTPVRYKSDSIDRCSSHLQLKSQLMIFYIVPVFGIERKSFRIVLPTLALLLRKSDPLPIRPRTHGSLGKGFYHRQIPPPPPEDKCHGGPESTPRCPCK